MTMHFIRQNICLTDPCEPDNSKLINVDDDRSTSCKDTSLSLCDNILSNGWYRIQKNDVDVKMPTTCVEQYSCGTVSPIWLKGIEIKASYDIL